MLHSSSELIEAAPLFACGCYGYCGFLACLLEGLLALCSELPLVDRELTPGLRKTLCEYTSTSPKIAEQESIS